MESIRGKKEKNGLYFSLGSYDVEGAESRIRTFNSAKQSSPFPMASATRIRESEMEFYSS